MSEELDNDIITLTDEDGIEHEFEILDIADIEGKVYAALLPLHFDSKEYADSDGQFVVFRVLETEDGEEILEGIDDDDELDRIIAVFEERLEDEYTLES